MTVRTHTFKLGKYRVDIMTERVDGWCDLPEKNPSLEIHVPGDNSKNALHTTIHEALHANGLHGTHLDKDFDVSEGVARFLWRLGWRRVGKQ